MDMLKLVMLQDTIAPAQTFAMHLQTFAQTCHRKYKVKLSLTNPSKGFVWLNLALCFPLQVSYEGSQR